MEVKNNMKNDMFKRHEFLFELEASKTPSFAEAKTRVAEELNKDEENVDVLNVYGKFGKNVFVIKANVYDSKEGLNKALLLRKTQKQKVADKKAAEEAKKAEAEAKKNASEEKVAE